MSSKHSFAALVILFITQSFQVCWPSAAIVMEDIRETYQAKHFSKTIHLSESYLQKHPNDVDASLYQGLAYSQLHQCHRAIGIFDSILLKYPNYQDARTALINCHLKLKNPKQAQDNAENGLKSHPKNSQLLSLNEKAHGELITPEPYPTRITVGPRNRVFEDIIPEDGDRPRFVTGIFTDTMGVNRPKQYWNLSNLYGYWINSLGTVGGSVNYATRFHQDAAQLELDAAPKIGKNMVLDLTYAHANHPELFPDQLARAELFTYFANEFEASLGGTYRKIAQYRLDSYTGSIGKYFGRNYFSFRPLYFQPGSGPRTLLFRIGMRHYADDPRQYVGLILMDGTSPDLTDLLTIDFIKIHDRLALLEVQQPLNKAVALQFGVGYEDMLYPNSQLRTLVHFNLGLKIGFM